MKRFIAFVKAYFAIRRQRDPQEIARLLGRPETLEISDDQAEAIEKWFCGPPDGSLPGLDAGEVAHWFFKAYPRTDFRYFMAPNEAGDALEFTSADLGMDGIELIQAAMVKRGAIMQSHLAEGDDAWYYQTAHPMTKRLAEIGSTFTPPERGRGMFA